MNNTPRFILVLSLFLCAHLSVYSQFTDLDLSIQTTNENPTIYTHVPLTYTLTNISTSTVVDKSVLIGVCGETTGSFFDEFSFVQENNLVYSLPTPTASRGSYNAFAQIWHVPELGVGESATLELNTFLLGDGELSIWGMLQNVASPGAQEEHPCSSDNYTGARLVLNDECTCEAEDAPVCGANGITYANACEAECADVFDYTDGACQVVEACGFNKTYPAFDESINFSNRVFYNLLETDSTYSIDYQTRSFNSGSCRTATLNLNKSGDLLSTTDTMQEAVATVEINEEKQAVLTRLNEIGDTLSTTIIDVDYPNITQLTNSSVYQVSDGLVFGGIIIDASMAVSFRGYLIKTDLEGNLIWQTTIPALMDVYNLFNITESAQKDLLVEWTASGDFSLTRIDSSGVFHWRTQVAADTPSTRWNDVAVSSDGAYVYAALTDNLIAEIKQIDMITGEQNIFNTGQIFNPMGNFSFTLGTGVLPLPNGDIIVSGAFNEGNAVLTGLEYGRITQNGAAVWSRRLLSENFNFNLAPITMTADGGFMFAGFHGDSLAVLKTNDIGEVEPLCANRLANLQVSNDQLHQLTEKNVGTDQQVNIAVYPTIVTDQLQLTIASKMDKVAFRIYNLQGHEMMKREVIIRNGNQQLLLNISALSKGIYFIKFDEQLEQGVIRFVKM